MWGGLKDWSRPLPERARGPAPPLLAHPPSGPEGPHRWGPTEIQKALRRVVLASALSRQRRDTAFLTPRGSVMLTWVQVVSVICWSPAKTSARLMS
jgi:hypothetical protein